MGKHTKPHGGPKRPPSGKAAPAPAYTPAKCKHIAHMKAAIVLQVLSEATEEELDLCQVRALPFHALRAQECPPQWFL